MDRRQFLAGLTTTGSVVIGGCSNLPSEPVSLDSPTVTTPDPGEYQYNLARKGDAVGNVDIRVEPRSTPSERSGLTLGVGPQPRWESTALRFAFRAPADASPGEPHARILVSITDIAQDVFRFRTADDGYRTVEADGLAKAGLGDSTLVLRLDVVPDEAVESLSLQSTTRWSSSQGSLVEASFTDRLSLPVTE